MSSPSDAPAAGAEPAAPVAETPAAGAEPAAPVAETPAAGAEPAASSEKAPPIVEDLLSDRPLSSDEIELAAVVDKKPTPPKASPQAAPRKSSLIYPGFHKRPGLR